MVQTSRRISGLARLTQPPAADALRPDWHAPLPPLGPSIPSHVLHGLDQAESQGRAALDLPAKTISKKVALWKGIRAQDSTMLFRSTGRLKTPCPRSRDSA
jgi:hypothetical protein